MTPEEFASELQSRLAPILANITPASEEDAVAIVTDYVAHEILHYKGEGVIRFFSVNFDQARHVVVHRGVANPALCVVQYAYYFKHGPARNGQYVARILKSENGTYRIKTGVWDEGELPFIDPAKRFSSVVVEAPVVEEPVAEPVVPAVVLDSTPAVEEDVSDLTELVAQAEADPEGSVAVNYSNPAVEEFWKAFQVEPDVTAALSEKTYEVEGLTEWVAQAEADPEGSVTVNYSTPSTEPAVVEPVAVTVTVATDNTDKPFVAPMGYTRRGKTKKAKEPLVGEETEVASNIVVPLASVDPEEPKE